jgi:hypothetical protein
MTHIPARIAMTMKVSAATKILFKCRRTGRSPALALELIITLGCCFLPQRLIKQASLLVPQM